MFKKPEQSSQKTKSYGPVSSIKTDKRASSIQTKLTIGRSDDKYEREADRVADQVVNNTPGASPRVSGIHQVQKMSDEEEVQAKPIPGIQRETEEELQTKSEGNGSQVASSAVTGQISQSKGSGSPLPITVRSQMESGIGADFSKVRIHTDSRAQNLSTELNAQAFTVGNDVYFNKGKYNPESQSGKHLLAHELTHTIQQGAAIQKKIQKQDETLAPVPDQQLTISAAMYALTLDSFTTGDASLTKDHTDAIDAQLPMIMSALKSDPSAYIIVAGHTDAVGKDGDNQRLGEKRAAAVFNYLLGKGLAASQVKSSAHGESQLRKRSKVAESVNRRVEISLSKVSQKLDVGLKLKEPNFEPPKPMQEVIKSGLEEKKPDNGQLDMEYMKYASDNGQPYDSSITFDKGASILTDKLLDSMGLKKGWIRNSVKDAIKKGVESGIDAGVDAALGDLDSEGKTAAKELIRALRAGGLNKGKTSDE